MGKPMLAYPIETARASGLFDLIVVSTDDAEIAAVAFAHGATVMPRPADDGSTGTQEIAARVLDQLEVSGMACVIYATSPLLMERDLWSGYEMLKDYPGAYAYSVGPNGDDAGCFYFGSTQAFRSRQSLSVGKAVPLPAERCCDINVPADWREAEAKYLALRRAHENN